MRKIDADSVLERVNDLETFEKEIEVAAKEEGLPMNCAVVMAALKLLRNIIDTEPTAPDCN